MKGIFIYDGPLSKDNENNYYGVALNNEMFDRYKTLISTMKIIIRAKDINNNEINGKSKINLRIHIRNYNTT